MVRVLFEASLGSLGGHRVHPLESLAELDSMLGKVTPDLIVLDGWMGEEGDSADWIKTFRRSQATRILVITGDSNPKRYEEAGATRALEKPVSPADLVETVNALIAA